MTGLTAPGFPSQYVRARARHGTAAIFPDLASYGHSVFGADGTATDHAADGLDDLRLVPPVFMPQRLHQLIELGREPTYDDVALSTTIGGFPSPLPLYISALGSTRAANHDLGAAAARQAGSLGIPVVIGENIAPMNGFGRLSSPKIGARSGETLLGRIRAYAEVLPDGLGGVAVQQSTEDADTEVWNMLYSDKSMLPLLESGRLAFELKVGQGAKPGLGGMTLIDSDSAARVADTFHIQPVHIHPVHFDPLEGAGSGTAIRSSSPGTFTQEILRQQIRLMRNNYPRARCWVKLPPGRDIQEAAATAWAAGADAVTVDGAEGGTGWAPTVFLQQAGLPLGECLHRIGRPEGCLLASGRMWEAGRAVKALALGATAVGLGRAALIAADEDHTHGVVRLIEAMALETRMLVSALGRYRVSDLDVDDLWPPIDAKPQPWFE